MAAGLGLTSPGPVVGQADSAAGSWRVTWAQAVRNNRDGTQEIQKWGDATLILKQDGEQVSGTWTSTALDQVTWQVSGTFRDGRLVLEATENDSDDPQLAVVERMRWRATLEGDRLDGQMTLEFRGRGARPWRPWRAERARDH